jgi:hypothetical protein
VEHAYYNANGYTRSTTMMAVDRYTKDFNQHPGYDYTNVLAPTMCLASICLVLALTATHDLLHGQWGFRQQDAASRDGTLTYTRLLKSLYRLKQAAMMWNKRTPCSSFGAGVCSS